MSNVRPGRCDQWVCQRSSVREYQLGKVNHLVGVMRGGYNASFKYAPSGRTIGTPFELCRS